MVTVGTVSGLCHSWLGGLNWLSRAQRVYERVHAGARVCTLKETVRFVEMDAKMKGLNRNRWIAYHYQHICPEL